MRDEEEQKVERPLGLHEQRMGAVLSVLRGIGAKRVVDLGCGEGKLLRSLMADPQFESILGMDVSWRSIEIAKRAAEDRSAPRAPALSHRPYPGVADVPRRPEIGGFDAAAVVEVIEHLDAPQLSAFERVLFEFRAAGKMRSSPLPNAEYNALFETLPAGQFRHRDHRFEWTRARVRGVGKIVGVSVRLSSPLPAGRPVRRGARSPHADGCVFRGRRAHREDRRSRTLARSPDWPPPARASRRSRANIFLPTEVISSDFCRGLVADDANDQSRDRRRVRSARLNRPQNGWPEAS